MRHAILVLVLATAMGCATVPAGTVDPATGEPGATVSIVDRLDGVVDTVCGVVGGVPLAAESLRVVLPGWLNTGLVFAKGLICGD